MWQGKLKPPGTEHPIILFLDVPISHNRLHMYDKHLQTALTFSHYFLEGVNL